MLTQGGRGHAKAVVFACDAAVSLEPRNGGYHDDRGLVRALTGDLTGAIEDLRTFIDWIDLIRSKDPEKAEWQALTAQRQRWIEVLQTGRTPFTPEELKTRLRLDPKTDAARQAGLRYLDEGRSLARSGNTEDAVDTFRKAQQLDSSLRFDPRMEAARLAAQSKLEEGQRLVREGKVAEALAAFAEAGQEPALAIPASSWNELCWFGSLYRHASTVMSSCEIAVAMEPENPSYFDSRGLARALTGNAEGAISDLELFIAGRSYVEVRKQRQRWIETLRKERKLLLDPEEFKMLLTQ